jgi:hypothetical protein
MLVFVILFTLLLLCSLHAATTPGWIIALAVGVPLLVLVLCLAGAGLAHKIIKRMKHQEGKIMF